MNEKQHEQINVVTTKEERKWICIGGGIRKVSNKGNEERNEGESWTEVGRDKKRGRNGERRR